MRLPAAGRAGSLASPLPMPFPALARAGVKFRRGGVSLTVAGTNAGKSQFWNNYAQRARVPTLYWSADTDRTDIVIRSIAVHLGLDAIQVEGWLQDEQNRATLFEQLGDRSDHIEWVFDSVIEGPKLGERMDAFGEIYGQYPHLVVVDNLRNAITDRTLEGPQTAEVISACLRLARATKAHVAILHHAKGEFENGNKPIPIGGALQNAMKDVDTGVTLFRPSLTQLGFCLVKARGAQADPGADRPILLNIDFAKSVVYGWQ